MNKLDERFAEMEALEEGWLDGEGHAISPSALSSAKERIEFAISKEIPIPYIYPTPEGHLSIEWESNNDYDVTAIFKEKSIFIMAINTKTDEENVMVLPANIPLYFFTETIRNYLNLPI